MQVQFSKKFKKQFDKTDGKIRSAFEQRLRLLMDNPNHPQLRNHRLTGQLQAYYSINVTGDWRAIFSMHSINGELVCIFEMIGTHSQLYQ